jgi:hypothetical protein
MQAPSTVSHTHTHARARSLGARDIHSIISLTACLSVADTLSLFKNIPYKTYVYFVMSLVSAFTDCEAQTPHIPSSRSSVLFIFFFFCQVCSETSTKAPSTVLHFLAPYFLLRCFTRPLELGAVLVMKRVCGISSAQVYHL